MQSPIAEPGAEQIRTKGGKCLDIFSHGLLDGAPLEVFGCDATVKPQATCCFAFWVNFIERTRLGNRRHRLCISGPVLRDGLWLQGEDNQRWKFDAAMDTVASYEVIQKHVPFLITVCTHKSGPVQIEN